MFKSTFKIPEYHLSQAAVHLWKKEIFASKIRVAIKRHGGIEGVNVNWIGNRMYDKLFKKPRNNYSVSQQSYFLKQAFSTASTLFFLMLQWLKMAQKTFYLCKKKSLVCKVAAASYRNTKE